MIKEALTVAASAFAGASFAFLRERYSAKLDKGKRDYAALREAHFALLQQYSQLVSIRDQFIVPDAKTQAPWLTMRPIVGFFEAPRLDIPKLLFILESPEPDLLNRLLIAQQKFLAINNYFDQRNAAHSEFQERLSSLQRDGAISSPAAIEAIEAKVGPALVGRLKTLTAAILSGYSTVLSFQEQQLADLAALSGRMFPKRRVPKFELLPADQRV